MEDNSLRKNKSTILIIGGEHSQFKKAMKDYICDDDKNKPMIVVNQPANNVENVNWKGL